LKIITGSHYRQFNRRLLSENINRGPGRNPATIFDELSDDYFRLVCDDYFRLVFDAYFLTRKWKFDESSGVLLCLVYSVGWYSWRYTDLMASVDPIPIQNILCILIAIVI